MLTPLVIVAACAAEPAAKPPCNQRNQGMVWPDRDARSPGTEIQVCSLKVWKYRWEPVTVSVSCLGRNAKRRGGCRTPEAPGKETPSPR